MLQYAIWKDFASPPHRKRSSDVAAVRFAEDRVAEERARTRSLEKRSSCSEKRSQKLGEAIAKLGEAIRDEGWRGEATATTSDSHNSDDEKLVEPITTKLGEAMTRSDQQRSDQERAI